MTQATGATFKVTSDMDDSIGSDNVVELAEGANVITIMVEAANAVATKTYTLTVTRAADDRFGRRESERLDGGIRHCVPAIARV